ncbi:MAG TPA: hypothetical protein VJP79_08560 [Nitrososphaera sp.]|nr:hypothetical protein [Nitrososphaera sp.]
MLDSDVAFILRLGSEQVEAELFLRRRLFVGVTRTWTRGSKIFFLRKSAAFIGFGIVASIEQLEGLESHERELCLQRNWCAKLHFSSLVRFYPPEPLSGTPVATLNPMTLHGSEIGESAASRIEELATVNIYT